MRVRGRWCERGEGEGFPFLVYSLSGQNSQLWMKQQSGARDFIMFSHTDVKLLVLGHIPLLSWEPDQETTLKRETDLGKHKHLSRITSTSGF